MSKRRGFKFIVFVLLFAIAIKSVAQKLPNVQTASLRAPANIKIDGKATEWDGQFKAYNKTTGIYYTIANDDDRLYLTVQTPNPDIIEKIIKGGITLTINSVVKKRDKNAPAVTFPIFDKNGPDFYIYLEKKPEATNDRAKYNMQTDSLTRTKNQQLTEQLKLIGLKGIIAVADSVISLYNDNNIKVAFALDNKMNYTYELAVPLSYLGLNKTSKFFYNVQLNGAAFYAIKVFEIRDGVYAYSTLDNKDHTYGIGPDGPIKIFPTDFWGEYTLAKKP